MRWVGIVALVLWARAAFADVGVVATGDAALHPSVGKHLEGWLRKQGKDVIAAPLSPSAVNTLADCFLLDDLKCARGVVEARSKSDSLVFVRVDVAGKNVTFNVHLFVKGHEAIGERRVCEKCSDDAWHSLADGMLTRLFDSSPRAVAPVEPPPVRASEERGGSRWLAGGLLTVGIASIATGGVFLYYGAIDGRDEKYLYPDSTPIGIVFAAVGAGATIGGTILLIQSGSSRSTPVASLTPGGGYLGWATRF